MVRQADVDDVNVRRWPVIVTGNNVEQPAAIVRRPVLRRATTGRTTPSRSAGETTGP